MNFQGFLVLILLLATHYSTILNIIQTLNGNFCFSQTYTESNLIADNVASLSVPYGNPNIDLQSYCDRRGTLSTNYTNTNYELDCFNVTGGFKCISRSISTKEDISQLYGCNCNKNSSDSDNLINLVVTRESAFQILNSTATRAFHCEASVRVGQCTLNSSFYYNFLYFEILLSILIALISAFTSSKTKYFEKFALRWGLNTDLLNKYGFLDYCDWTVGGRSYCQQGKGFKFSDSAGLITGFDSETGVMGFYTMSYLDGSYELNFKIGQTERFLKIQMSEDDAAALSICLRVLIGGGKIHEGDHFLSIEEIVNECKKGKRLVESGYSGFLYGRNYSLLEKMLTHSFCFFGMIRYDAIKNVLKHNIRNPYPASIKSSEWKIYLSDVNFHIGLRKSSKVKKFGESKGFLDYKERILEGNIPKEVIRFSQKGYLKLTKDESSIIFDGLKKSYAPMEEKEEKKEKEKEEKNVIESFLEKDEPGKEPWVKNHCDGVPTIFKADDPEVLKKADSFWVHEGEAVRKAEGCFKFSKSYMDVLKMSNKDVFIRNTICFDHKFLEYQHKGLVYKRDCPHGMKSELFEPCSKHSKFEKLDNLIRSIGFDKPAVKRGVYGNYKKTDVDYLKNIKKTCEELSVKNNNRFVLPENFDDFLVYGDLYSFGNEINSIFFLPNEIGKDVTVDKARLDDNIKKVENFLNVGDFNSAKFGRVKSRGHGRKGRSKGGKKRKGKKQKKQKKEEGSCDGNDDPLAPLCEATNFNSEKRHCVKKLSSLESLYINSEWFRGEVHNSIRKVSEEGKELLSSNKMCLEGVTFRQAGLPNSILSSIYKKVFVAEGSDCLVMGNCRNLGLAQGISTNMIRCIRAGYIKDRVLLDSYSLLDMLLKDTFLQKFGLKEILEMNI